jgi:hypothetical protein
MRKAGHFLPLFEALNEAAEKKNPFRGAADLLLRFRAPQP